MRAAPGRPSGFVFAFSCFVLFAAGCAGTKQQPTGIDGGGGSSGGRGGNVDSGPPPPDGVVIGDPNLCGNGTMDPNEACDDGNRDNGDGCSRFCQKSALYDCPTPGQLCVIRAKCGDATLSSNEACDDGNTTAGDGCSADCKTVEGGFLCRVPGRPCVPNCGDGMIKATPTVSEQCDDGNTMNGDGCSANCLLEFGASCPTPGQPCKTSVCGNGMVEAGESCDEGTRNGLFLGNGMGCSKTCTREPSCRSAAGATQACAVTCGNGNIETGEECDDGNLGDGDGCSAMCKNEANFDCMAQTRPDTEPCASGTGECLRLPVIYRDFKSEKETGGHPDFFFLGAPVASPVQITGVTGQTGAVTFSKRYCVPNSGGPAKQNDSTARCWDLAQANLGPNGKPVFNMARSATPFLCDCQFTDWSHTGNGGHVPGYGDAMGAGKPLNGLAYAAAAVAGNMTGAPWYKGPAPIVKDKASFEQWFVDSTFTGNTHTVGTMDLAPLGNGQYQFSSAVHAIYGGFFPVDPMGQFPVGGSTMGPGAMRMVGTEPMLCNLWPYWYSTTGFGGGAGCVGDQYLFPPSITTPMWAPAITGWFHNFWYTTEVRYLLNYTGPFELAFYGDDDLFIFINGRLVLDLGGVHQRLPGRVQVDGAGMAMTIEGGALTATGVINPCPGIDPMTMVATTSPADCRARTINLGMEVGRTYEIAVFHADRHPTESNFQLTLSGFATKRTTCTDRCGNGVVKGAEECDEGMNNNDATYGGCTTACKYGPYCGDGMVNGPEECDLGSAMNNSVYSPTQSTGCSPGCTWPHYCGDGILDDGDGEECDLGPNNGPSAPCSTMCRQNIL